jgi:5-methylcytosine-specific restriction protein A
MAMSSEDIVQEWKDEIGISKDEWTALLMDRNVFRESDIELLTIIYACEGHMATASQLAHMLGLASHRPLNSQVGRLGKRIAKSTGVEAPTKKRGEGYNWFNIPFWGSETRHGRRYYWILRPELQEAMEELACLGRLKLLNREFLPEEITNTAVHLLVEGLSTRVNVNRYERSALARYLCVRHHGSACSICGFDFAERYGEEFRGMIHVHHVKPLSQIDRQYEVDYVTDLLPVCPNCHAVIHRKDPPYSPSEVGNMIKLPSQ